MKLSHLLTLAMVHVAVATPSPAQKFQPTFAHFSTESANKDAPFFDLAPWGYDNPGGRLPKAYDLGTGGNMSYLPDKSWERFQEIRAGKRNVTASSLQTLGATPLAIAATGDAVLSKRDEVSQRDCNAITFEVETQYGCYSGIAPSCADHSVCFINTCPNEWQYVYVYGVQNAYITFWTSKACNGAKGSINPNCNSGSTYHCQLNRAFNSLRIYSGCHQQYDDDGCI